jgi:hypothetical protein
VAPTPTDSTPPALTTAGAPPPSPGPLTLRVSIPGQIGVDTYRSPFQLGWTSAVYDNFGEVSRGCYVSWALYQGEDRIYTYSTVCSSNPYTGLRLGPGTYNFVGNITTDDGRTVTGSKTFYVTN